MNVGLGMGFEPTTIQSAVWSPTSWINQAAVAYLNNLGEQSKTFIQETTGSDISLKPITVTQKSDRPTTPPLVMSEEPVKLLKGYVAKFSLYFNL